MGLCHGLLSVLVLFAAFQSSLTASLYGLEYNPEDFVVAQPTCVHRLPLTKVNRQWRGKGIRSFTVLNDTKLVEELNQDPESRENLEAYGYWEDDSAARGSWRGSNIGDTRAAVTPFLAHRHFGETYKWMLYGDDDTLFYMTGVLKLLSQFDPELPLAITDNLWFMSAHPAPAAPRCLPCGFNTSTITTNHTFTPRPVCPFCARALACGTYGPRYHCTAAQLTQMEQRFGPNVTRFPAGGAEGAGAVAAAAGAGGADPEERRDEQQQQQRVALRAAAANYSRWMDRQAELKSRFPLDLQKKFPLDWEMRELADVGAVTLGSGSGSGLGSGSGARGGGDGGTGEVADAAYDGRRRRRRRRLAERREDGGLHWAGEDSDLDLDPAETQAGGSRSRSRGGRSGQAQQQSHRRSRSRRRLQSPLEEDSSRGSSSRGRGLGSGVEAARGRVPHGSVASEGLQEPRSRPVGQEFVDGAPFLSAALGGRVAPGDPEAQALRLPPTFCAQHDERLHAQPAPSCLFSVSGHGGTGIIFSVGLLRMIEAEEAIRFITQQTGCGGGDCLLGRVLWFRMGIGFTDPGTALQEGSYKYDKYTRFIDSNAQMTQLITLADPPAVLLNRRRGTARAPFCDRSCVWLVENVVGTHVRAQKREVNSTVAEMLRRLQNHARAYEWILEARRDPLVLAGNTTIVRAVKARHGNHHHHHHGGSGGGSDVSNGTVPGTLASSSSSSSSSSVSSGGGGGSDGGESAVAR